MKHTTNFIVYLNADNKVHLARCKITGRFVKLSVAQNEYEKEYNYLSFSMLTILSLFFITYLSSLVNKFENLMTTLTLNIDQALTYFMKGHTIVLFIHLNTYLFNSKVNNKDEMVKFLSSGEVEKGRIL